MSEDTSRDVDLIEDEDDVDVVDPDDAGDDSRDGDEEVTLATLKTAVDEMRSVQKELLAEREELRKRLAKANAEAKKYRLRTKGVKVSTPKEETEEDEDRSAVASHNDEVSKLARRALLADVRTELIEAGVKGKQKATRLSKLIDLSELEYDEYGINGLDEQIDSLKEEFPELFANEEPQQVEVKPARTVSVPRKPVTGERNKRESGRTLTTAEKLARSIHNR